MKIEFSKFQGFGNDYVVIEAEQLKEVAGVSDFTKRFCHRTLGVGSDGIAILEKLNDSDADFSCRIINPDGSPINPEIPVISKVPQTRGAIPKCCCASVNWGVHLVPKKNSRQLTS